MQKKIFQTILVIIFWDFLMFYQIFLSPQVKQIVIISNKHDMYKLNHKLPKDLRLKNYQALSSINNTLISQKNSWISEKV